jgi:hypothetical protein
MHRSTISVKIGVKQRETKGKIDDHGSLILKTGNPTPNQIPD